MMRLELQKSLSNGLKIGLGRKTNRLFTGSDCQADGRVQRRILGRWLVIFGNSEIRKLMTLAYPGKTTTHSEAFAVQSYISALLDRSLALSVAEREPKDLQQAYQISLRLQAFRQAEADGNREANRNKQRV